MVRKGSLSYRKRIAALLQFRLTLPGPLMLWMLLLPWRRHAGGSPKVSWRSRVTTAPSEQLISRTGMTMTMVVITMVMMMLSMMSMMRQRTTVTIHSSAVRRLLNLFFFVPTRTACSRIGIVARSLHQVARWVLTLGKSSSFYRVDPTSAPSPYFCRATDHGVRPERLDCLSTFSTRFVQDLLFDRECETRVS